MSKSGYSGTPLAKKLGIRENFRIKLVNAPEYYFELFSDLPAGIKIIKDKTSKKDLVHYFVVHVNELNSNILNLKQELEQNGMLWVSWYKRAAKQATDVTEDRIRAIALKNGLVDIKVCAINELWSGLKLVIPVKNRTG